MALNDTMVSGDHSELHMPHTNDTADDDCRNDTPVTATDSHISYEALTTLQFCVTFLLCRLKIFRNYITEID